MSLRKRMEHRTVRRARKRLAGMENIDEGKGSVIDYGHGDHKLSSREFSSQIRLCEELNSQYNQKLIAATGLLNDILSAERALAAMYSEVLSGAKGKFGRDSSEVEILGGTRTSERKKKSAKKGAAKSGE